MPIALREDHTHADLSFCSVIHNFLLSTSQQAAKADTFIMTTFSFPTLLVALLLPVSVTAFPTGAGGCVADEAAIGGPHASAEEIPFEPYTVLLNDSIQLTSSTSLVQGESYKITLVSSTNTFRGGLLRMQGAGDLEASTNGRILEEICGDAQGVTHTSATDKTELSAFYTVSPDDTEVTLDVTVVPTIASYTHSQFVIAVEAGGSEGAASPGGDDSSTPAPASANPTSLSPTTASPTTTSPTTMMPTAATPTTAMPVASRVEPESSFITVTPAPQFGATTPAPGPAETAMPTGSNPAPIGFPVAAPVMGSVFVPVPFVTTPPANVIPIAWTAPSLLGIDHLAAGEEADDEEEETDDVAAEEADDDEEEEDDDHDDEEEEDDDHDDEEEEDDDHDDEEEEDPISSRTEESASPTPSAVAVESSLSPSPHMDGSSHMDGGFSTTEESPTPNMDPFPSIPLTWTPAPAGSASTLDALASGSSTKTLVATFAGVFFTLLAVY